MLYLVIARTRPDLSGDEFARLAELAKAFYGHIPKGLALRGNWAERDGARTFALLEADDPALVEQVQAPFRPLVDIEIIPIAEISGWHDAPGAD